MIRIVVVAVVVVVVVVVLVVVWFVLIFEWIEDFLSNWKSFKELLTNTFFLTFSGQIQSKPFEVQKSHFGFLFSSHFLCLRRQVKQPVLTLLLAGGVKFCFSFLIFEQRLPFLFFIIGFVEGEGILFEVLIDFKESIFFDLGEDLESDITEVIEDWCIGETNKSQEVVVIIWNKWSK